MPYRKTRRSREQLARMKRGQSEARMAGPAPEYPRQLPRLRRRIVVIDYDFGTTVHVLDLYRTTRIDSYRAIADGRPWQDRIGWSGVLAGLRKSMPRISAKN